jgi:magnesium transporter
MLTAAPTARHRGACGSGFGKPTGGLNGVGERLMITLAVRTGRSPMTVDCAYYVRGIRQPQEPMSVAEAAALQRRGGQYVWIELEEPEPELMDELCRDFGLHELAVEDAGRAHERPKVESFDGFHLIVYKTARYDERSRHIEFGELDIFLGPGYVIAVRHGAAGDPIRTRFRVEQHPELLKTGPAAVVWGLLDVVVDDYAPVVERLDGEIDDLERAIFAGREDMTERIYLLKVQANELYRALHPLLAPLEAVDRGEFQVDPGLARYFRDIADHVRRLQDEVITLREQLAAALEANLALISVRQNEIATQQSQVVKQLTLVATVFLPLTFVTGFFGQNFGWMVEQIDSEAAFWITGVGGLLIAAVALLLWFRSGGLVEGPGVTATSANASRSPRAALGSP